jgi:uncharacterized integral membrane protein
MRGSSGPADGEQKAHPDSNTPAGTTGTGDTSTPPPASEPVSDAESDVEPVKEYRGAGIMWGAIALVVVAAAFVIVAVQNAHDVEFDFLWLTVTTPLILVIAITIAVTLVIDELVGFLWRRQRRTRLSEREELRRLRSERRGGRNRSKQ